MATNNPYIVQSREALTVFEKSDPFPRERMIIKILRNALDGLEEAEQQREELRARIAALEQR
jgi:hypothetical protein